MDEGEAGVKLSLAQMSRTLVSMWARRCAFRQRFSEMTVQDEEVARKRPGQDLGQILAANKRAHQQRSSPRIMELSGDPQTLCKLFGKQRMLHRECGYCTDPHSAAKMLMLSTLI